MRYEQLQLESIRINCIFVELMVLNHSVVLGHRMYSVGGNNAICARPTPKRMEITSITIQIRCSLFWRFIFYKILLITNVKCDFVCRTNTQLQVLSSSDAMYTMHIAQNTLWDDEHMCECVFVNGRSIKWLEPHAIYHEDDVCMQTKWNRLHFTCKSTHTHTSTSLAIGREFQRSPRSYYLNVYYHLHQHFFFVQYLSWLSTFVLTKYLYCSNV